jgi:hypothetical protein
MTAFRLLMGGASVATAAKLQLLKARGVLGAIASLPIAGTDTAEMNGS